jgi:hypothetical protein
VLKNVFPDENIIENNTLVCGKHQNIVPKSIRNNSHQNLIFLKLKLGCQPNRITNSSNSEIEPFHDKVGKVKLSLVK